MTQPDAADRPDAEDRPDADGEDGLDHLRVHYGMSGSAPLSLYEFVFEPTGVYAIDAGSFSPMFGLMRGKHTRAARGLDSVYREDGVDGLLACAESVTWLGYDALDRVRVYDGGWVARPKLGLSGERSLAVRLHDVDPDDLVRRLRAFLAARDVGLAVESRRGSGLF